jgi:hypothetical protein
VALKQLKAGEGGPGRGRALLIRGRNAHAKDSLRPIGIDITRKGSVMVRGGPVIEVVAVEEHVEFFNELLNRERTAGGNAVGHPGSDDLDAVSEGVVVSANRVATRKNAGKEDGNLLPCELGVRARAKEVANHSSEEAVAIELFGATAARSGRGAVEELENTPIPTNVIANSGLASNTSTTHDNVGISAEAIETND